MFKNREEAGKKLAEKLSKYKGKESIIVAIPRGGVVIGYEVAESLGAKLDFVITRKLGFPSDSETAMGAIAQDGSVVLDKEGINYMRVSEKELDKIKTQELKEISRRLKVYRGKRESPVFKDKIVIVVDDGVATGLTALAAIRFLKKTHPKKIVFAVPTGPSEVLNEIGREVDEVIVVETPYPFFAISGVYEDFPQVSDKEIIDLLKKVSN
jgi:predicted phosphoribosyltransferase